MKRKVRPSPLKLGTVSYGALEPRIAFSAAFAPYFAKVEVASEQQKPRPSS